MAWRVAAMATDLVCLLHAQIAAWFSLDFSEEIQATLFLLLLTLWENNWTAQLLAEEFMIIASLAIVFLLQVNYFRCYSFNHRCLFATHFALNTATPTATITRSE